MSPLVALLGESLLALLALAEAGQDGSMVWGFLGMSLQKKMYKSNPNVSGKFQRLIRYRPSNVDFKAWYGGASGSLSTPFHQSPRTDTLHKLFNLLQHVWIPNLILFYSVYHRYLRLRQYISNATIIHYHSNRRHFGIVQQL